MGRRDSKRSREKLESPSSSNATDGRRTRAKSFDEEEPPEKQQRYTLDIRILEFPKIQDVIVGVPLSKKYSIQGKCNVKCLYGAAEMFGHTLNPDDQFHPVFSTETNSYITVKAARGVVLSKVSDELSSYINQLEEVDEELLHQFIHNGQKNQLCFLHLKPLKSVVCGFISRLSSYKGIVFTCKNKSGKHVDDAGEVTLHSLDVALSRSSQGKDLQISSDFEFVTKELNKALNKRSVPVLAVCGGKNVGKSTLCRFVVNNLLNSCGRVAYMECDVGQTEFTPSGCVALNIVSKPLFGAPFTHVQEPVRSVYLGLLSPGDDPGRYIQSIEYLFDAYQSLDDKPPLVINTMGWNKGLGLAMLVDLINMMTPSILVQLDSKSRSKNMPSLSPEFFQTATGWKEMSEIQQDDIDSSPNKLKFTHIAISSQVSPESESNDRYKAVDHRNLTLLAYLGGSMEMPLSLNSLQPYKVPWKDVAVHVAHTSVPNSQILSAINASVVGFCTVDESLIVRPGFPDLPGFLKETPKSNCLGFGLVRSIDEAEKVFYVITPVPVDVLQKVNCFIRGALDMPQQIFMDQLHVDDVPYIGYPKDVIGASSVSRRRHMQRHRPK